MTRRALAVALALAAVTVAVYWPVARHDFVDYDDPVYVQGNRVVQRGLTAAGLRYAFRPSVEASNWHPLTWLSHMVDVQLFGLQAGAHHLVNVALHALNAVLLFLLLRRMTGALWRSALVAALFALHPLHVESVAWIAERKDVLSTVFFMLTLWAYVAWTERGGTWRYLLMAALYGLGLMAKPMLVTLPFVLLLLDLWPLRRWPAPGEAARGGAARSSADSFVAALVAVARRRVIEKLPLFALSAASCVVTFLVQREGGAMRGTEAVPLVHRLASAVVSYGMYLVKTVWPAALSPFYRYRSALPAYETALWGLGLMAVTAAALAALRRRPYVAVGWLWYVGMLVPVIGLVQVGMQSMADRYTYVPLAGIFVIVVWGVADLVRERRALAFVAACVAVVALGLLSVTTRHQLGYWRDSETLWRQALALDPDNYVAHNNLGMVKYERGERQKGEEFFQAAEGHFRAALDVLPTFADARTNLGMVLTHRGRLEEAEAELRRSIELNPRQARTYNNLGLVLVAGNRIDEGIRAYGEALRLEPGLDAAETNWASALVKAGRPDEAVPHARRAVELSPENPNWRFNLGLDLVAAGNLSEAADVYRDVLRLQPDHFGASYRLAWILAAAGDERLRNGRLAVDLAEKLQRAAGPSEPMLMDLLAAALAEEGEFARAAALANEARDRAAAQNRPRLAADIAGRAALYAQGQACRAFPQVEE